MASTKVAVHGAEDEEVGALSLLGESGIQFSLYIDGSRKAVDLFDFFLRCRADVIDFAEQPVAQSVSQARVQPASLPGTDHIRQFSIGTQSFFPDVFVRISPCDGNYRSSAGAIRTSELVVAVVVVTTVVLLLLSE